MGGMTVVKNEKDELIPQRTVTGWRAPIIIKPDWSLSFEIMCDASDYVVGVVLGKMIDKHFKPINYASKNNKPWYADYANYLASRVLPFRSTRQEKQKFFSDLRNYYWDESFLLNSMFPESYEGTWPEMRQHKLFHNITANHLEDIMASPPPQKKSSRLGFIGHISSKMHVSWYKFAMDVNELETSHQGTNTSEIHP
nr:hypothetical protein [Tanacetum cinerariifolium]